MSTKLHFDPNIPTPQNFSEAIHQVIEACGYRLRKQELLHVEYEAPGKRITFSCLGLIKFEEWEAADDEYPARWNDSFRCNFKMKIDEIALLDILHSVGALNYFQVPEIRKEIRRIMDTIRTNVKPKPSALTTEQLQKAMAA